MLAQLLLSTALLAPPDSARTASAAITAITAIARDSASASSVPRIPATLTDTAPRPRAIEYSDWYGRRLTIHRVGSYTMLPLFAGEWVLGNRLLSTSPQPTWISPAHQALAWGTAALFTTNTITGAWNLWDARHDPEGRTRRVIHSALMLASEAGFVYTGAIANQAKFSVEGANRHRNAALVSMGLSTAGTVMMWLWKD